MSLSAGLVLMLTAGFVSLCWFGVDVNSGVCLSLLVGCLMLTAGLSPSAGLVLMLTAGFVSLCWFGVDVNSGVCLPLRVAPECTLDDGAG